MALLLPDLLGFVNVFSADIDYNNNKLILFDFADNSIIANFISPETL